MSEIVLTRLNGTVEDVLIFPVKLLLEISLPVVIGVVVVVVCCFLTSCVVCFYCGRRSLKKEKNSRKRPRLERDGTIYSEVNPVGMIENQNRTLRLNKRQSVVMTSFTNKHTTPPTPPPMKLTPTQTPTTPTQTPTTPTHIPTTPTTKHLFQKSVSTESAYQEMIPMNLRNLNNEMEPIEENCEKVDNNVGVFIIEDANI